MKVLRLFIGNNLKDLIDWTIHDEGNQDEKGSSTLQEIALFEQMPLEVYLSIETCSIVKTTTPDISSRRLSDELVLGLIEDQLVDDINLVKPIILNAENNILYIAIFNREYYEKLIEELQALNKPIRFITSFALATQTAEGAWTVYLSQNQNFIRISQYEFFALDDNQPIPIMLTDLLENPETTIGRQTVSEYSTSPANTTISINKPQQLIVYAADNLFAQVNTLANMYKIDCRNAKSQYNLGGMVWNFYNHKTTSFKIKLDNESRRSLKTLFTTVKYLVIALAIVWGCEIISFGIGNYRIQHKLQRELSGIIATGATSQMNIIADGQNKITKLSHERGLYDNTDAITLFTKFLEIVSTVDTNNIQQINFSNGTLKIILNSNFDTSQFMSYKDILKTKHVNINIQSYKDYMRSQNSNNNNNNSVNNSSDDELIHDAKWVVTLTPYSYQRF